MPVRAAVPIRLDDIDRKVLTRRAHAPTVAARDGVRARIVLAAAGGASNAVIAATEHVHVDTVRKWRGRYAANGLAGLADAPRSGRPVTFTPLQIAEVKAMACSPPADATVGLSRWSHRDLRAAIVDAAIVGSISTSSIRRVLVADAIKPWQHRSWIFPRDPDFERKAARVLDLYDRTWDGQTLGADEYVISADEKSQLQALHRRHSTLPAAPGRVPRVEFEYRRGGTLAYFAAYDVHRARVSGRIAEKTGIVPFEELVEQVMTVEPYKSAARVFWVVDNGSSHNGTRSIERMKTTWPTADLVHLPVHASWLNQVEIYFSILQRKAITPADFADLAALERRVLAFQNRYNQTATPFDWRYRRDDLTATLARLDTAA
jgi:transposase